MMILSFSVQRQVFSFIFSLCLVLPLCLPSCCLSLSFSVSTNSTAIYRVLHCRCPRALQFWRSCGVLPNILPARVPHTQSPGQQTHCAPQHGAVTAHRAAHSSRTCAVCAAASAGSGPAAESQPLQSEPLGGRE